MKSQFDFKESNEKIKDKCITRCNVDDYVPFSDFLSREDPTLNGYCFLHEIGYGKLSQVFKVIKIDTGEIFAAKVYNNSQIYHSSLSNESPYIAIQRELDIMTKLSHRYLLSIVDAFNDSTTNTFIIILCFAPNGTLKSLIDSRKLQKEQLNLCFYQIALALDYMHSNNVVHRDIKPGNILSFSDDYFVLSDLNSSQELNDSNEKVANTKGSLAFMSPEECKGGEFYPKPADVWAYGVSMFSSYFGMFPFDLDSCGGETMASSLMKISEQLNKTELRFPNDDDKELNALLTKILDKDPMKRPTFREISLSRYFDESRIIDQNLCCEEEEEEIC